MYSLEVGNANDRYRHEGADSSNLKRVIVWLFQLNILLWYELACINRLRSEPRYYGYHKLVTELIKK